MDPNISPRRDVVTDDDRQRIAEALPHAPSTVPKPPRTPAAATVDPARLASMVALIELGVSPERADLSVAERAAWNRLAADVARIHAAGDVVDVPPEWFG